MKLKNTKIKTNKVQFKEECFIAAHLHIDMIPCSCVCVSKPKPHIYMLI